MIRTSRYRRHLKIAYVAMILLASVFSCGCQSKLDTRYGVPRGSSINGINCFIDIVRQSGRKVDVWPVISPQMSRNYQTLIVFESSFDEVSEKLRRDIQNLMVNGSVKTLIFVVRDSDIEPEYWRQIRDQSTPRSQEYTDAGQFHDSSQASLASDAKGEFEPKSQIWCGLKLVDRTGDKPQKEIVCQSEEKSFTVDACWPLNRRLQPTESAKVLWQTGDDPLLTIEETKVGKIIVLASATPLLNGGLADLGNRRLASEFTEQIPKDGKVAVAFSSWWLDRTKFESPSLLRFLKVHPNGWVFGQGILALLLFCWWRFPILGRPYETVNIETARFGRHVDAFGQLLRRTRNRTYAEQRIQDWHGIQKPKSDSEMTNS